MATSDDKPDKAEGATKKAAAAKPPEDAPDAEETVEVELIAGKPETMPRSRAEALAAEGHAAAAAALEG